MKVQPINKVLYSFDFIQVKVIKKASFSGRLFYMP